MNRIKGILPYTIVCGVVTVALTFYLAPIGTVHAFTTTTTVTGWLFPDGAHWNNGIGALLFPIAGVGLFAGMAKTLDLEGDFGVTLILAGLTIGGLLAMLSLTSSSSSVLPFALVLVPAADLIFWVWKGGG